MKRKLDLFRHAPLGARADAQFATFCVLAAASLLYSLLYFHRFSNYLDLLYQMVGIKKVLIEGAIMPDFVVVLEDALTWFWGAAVCCLLAIPFNYAHHYKETKSIYTMRRLPERFELHRRCLSLPVAGAVILLALSFLMLVLYFWHYMAKVPQVCLTPDQWAKIWSVIR